MEKFCVIIPNRPGREQLFDNCMCQIRSQTVQPDKIYNINYKEVSKQVDISERIVSGIGKAKEDGIDLCFIFENDDAYAPDYLGRYGDMSQADFFGQAESIYYNIKEREYMHISHPGRASLYTTGFRISALEKNNFQFPKNTPFVDLALWKYVNGFKVRLLPTAVSAVGIKGHGIGISGGKGHSIKLSKRDPFYNWLRLNTTKESFEFYMSL